MSLSDPLEERLHADDQENRRQKVGRVPNSILFLPLPKSGEPPCMPNYTQIYDSPPRHDFREMRFRCGFVEIVIGGEPDMIRVICSRYQETRLWEVRQVEDIRDEHGVLHVGNLPSGTLPVLSIRYEEPEED